MGTRAILGPASVYTSQNYVTGVIVPGRDG